MIDSRATRAHVTRRGFLRGIGLVGAGTALASCAQQQGTDEGGQGATSAEATPLLAIIHTNDTHGHDVEVKSEGETEGNFTMAAIPALREELEAQGYEVITVDAGDASQGTPLVDTAKGAPAIAFMNSCGYDLMAVGNHEFDWGREALAANEAAAKFPMLSANVLKKEDGSHRFEQRKVIELAGGTKVGFFGLTTPETYAAEGAKRVGDLEFLNGADLWACAQEQVDALRDEGCEIVVGVGHLGNEATDEQCKSKTLLEHVSGIDLFIDGHDHNLVEEEVAGTLLVETGCYLHNIGVVVIDEGVPTNRNTPYGTFDGKDQATLAIIEAEDERTSSELAVALGENPYLLNGEREPGVRTEETNLGDFCADAFRWSATQETGTEVDCAVLNAGGLRVSLDPGDITLRDVKTLMPFSNKCVVITVTGEQLLEALEAALQCAGTDIAIGSFPQVSNIRLTVNTSVPYEQGPAYPESTYTSPAAPGARVTIEDVGGRGFDAGDTYTLATTDFTAAGGDAYYAFGVASETEPPTSACFDYEAIVSYLVEGCDHTIPEQYAEPQGRITFVS